MIPENERIVFGRTIPPSAVGQNSIAFAGPPCSVPPCSPMDPGHRPEGPYSGSPTSHSEQNSEVSRMSIEQRHNCETIVRSHAAQRSQIVERSPLKIVIPVHVKHERPLMHNDLVGNNGSGDRLSVTIWCETCLHKERITFLNIRNRDLAKGTIRIPPVSTGNILNEMACKLIAPVIFYRNLNRAPIGGKQSIGYRKAELPLFPRAKGMGEPQFSLWDPGICVRIVHNPSLPGQCTNPMSP